MERVGGQVIAISKLLQFNQFVNSNELHEFHICHELTRLRLTCFRPDLIQSGETTEMGELNDLNELSELYANAANSFKSIGLK